MNFVCTTLICLVLWNKVAAQTSNIKRMEDQWHELEVYVGTDLHQRSLRVSKLDLIIIIKFTANLYP